MALAQSQMRSGATAFPSVALMVAGSWEREDNRGGSSRFGRHHIDWAAVELLSPVFDMK